MKRADLRARKEALTDARLSEVQVPTDGLTAGRVAALARLREMTLPHMRDEYWKYTRPAQFTDADVTSAPLGRKDAPVFAGVDALRVVFTDGVFDKKASDKLEGEGIEILRMADVTADHWAAEFYGSLEATGHVPVARGLAALNTVRATDGVVIHAKADVSRPVAIEYRRTCDDADVVLHHCFKVDAGAALTVLEDGDGAARISADLEADIADRGAFHFVRVQGRSHGRRSANHIFTRLGEESTFKSFTLSVNGLLTRNEVIMELTGDDAIAHVAGACVGDGKDFHHDDTVFITHDAVNCESRQVFKKVLRNQATGVFQGKILVKEDAQKTDGYQISQSLLLGEDAQFLAKPELEIYADDVACSHGSTSGAIDEEGLFYLRSRGVPETEAVDMLTLAFLAEALDEIDNDDLAEVLLETLTNWLAERG